ncbi:hypothetical protein Tco_0266732 [Tanacetum coccineum]
MDEDQAGPDLEESSVSLARLNPEPTHDDFMANVYPNVHESLKFLADEHVILEDPLSSSETLSSMKNLDDAYTIGDQFLNDKSTEDESGKLNVEAEVVSMVIDSNLSSIFLSSSTIHTYDYSDLAARVTTLEQKFFAFEQKSKTLDNTTQNLGSKVFTLELRDMPHKINQTVDKVVKEVVRVALQSPLRDHFRELPEADMKEILHQRMFESGTYKSLPEHVALYEALETSMKSANRDEFFSEKDKSRKRRRDDQDPHPLLPDSDPSKKRRLASDASAPHFDQPVKDVPIPDNVNVSDSEDTDTAHLPNIKTRLDWLKPVPEEDKPATPELEWFQMEECHLLLTDQVDLVNPEGHRVVPDVRKPLPLRGPPGQLGVESYQTKLNFTQPDWDASDFLFKEDYTIVSKPMAVIYKDRNDQKKMMRETEVHKFSDDTLNKILDKLDHMVKDFKLFKFNPGIETRIWSEDDRKKSMDFMEVIERRLKIRIIFRSLESFVGGRLRDVDYRLIQRTK